MRNKNIIGKIFILLGFLCVVAGLIGLIGPGLEARIDAVNTVTYRPLWGFAFGGSELIVETKGEVVAKQGLVGGMSYMALVSFIVTALGALVLLGALGTKGSGALVIGGLLVAIGGGLMFLINKVGGTDVALKELPDMKVPYEDFVKSEALTLSKTIIWYSAFTIGGGILSIIGSICKKH